MEKLGEFLNKDGSLIISDLSLLEYKKDFNVKLDVEKGSNWNVWFEENEELMFTKLYATVGTENEIVEENELKEIEETVIIESSNLIIMNQSDFGNDDAIDWDIENILEFEDDIPKFYVGVVDRLYDPEIALYKFGVAINTAGDGEYVVKIQKKNGFVTKILIELAEDE